MLRATIFDMDGLLLDSEKLWHEAEVEILGDLGVPINRDGTRLTKGMFVAEVVSFWNQRHPWSGPSESDVVDQILGRVGDLVEDVGEMMPGAVRALELTGERGPIVVGSSTPLPLIERCLRHFDLLSHFQSLHSADSEPYGKPHPGVFLSAARALGVAPSACLVVEDSAAGVLAAKAGRMTCVAVPVPEERRLPAFGIADLVLESLNDLSSEWLDERFVA
ncbi:MAG: hexitol phosphatase HxpB [Acidobacteria bacterium]|nr:hexitol phosphatase HxpB [Acidobacteriota bacterium]